MINLYNDPQGNKIFDKSLASIKDSANKRQAMPSVHNHELPEAMHMTINDAHVQCVSHNFAVSLYLMFLLILWLRWRSNLID